MNHSVTSSSKGRTITNIRKKHSRNAPCICGSGKKFKVCCLIKQRLTETENRRIEQEARDEQYRRWKARQVGL